ncbi:TetR/AcrR family transcriptional regulator [Nocardia sp. CA-119907]|uniref:TetR/AcrR family transcriptional regulator n=1 Tax=Nocardia sp. CA-119907 TaxID=3239973 RepID=UPI003D98531D
MHAAWNELTEVGYNRFGFDGVASRAGTNKTTIYRRWPSRAALAIAAFRAATPADQVPDTGELRTDVLAMLRGAADRIASHQGEILHVLATELHSDPELLREVRDQLTATAITRWLTVLGRAVARGQARPEALTPRIATAAIDLLRTEYLVRGITTIPEDTIVEITDTIYLPLVAIPATQDR